MTVPALLGIDLRWAAASFNALIDAAIVFEMVRIARGAPVFRLLLPVLYVLHPGILYYSGNGMELSLVVGLALLTSRLYWAERPLLAGLAAGAIVVCRIDGVLFVAGLGLLATWVARRLPWRFALGAALGFAPWALFAVLSYGGITPASAQAKRIWYAGAGRLDVFHLHEADIILLVPAMIGLVGLFRWKRAPFPAPVVAVLRSFVAWMVVFSAFFMVLGVRVVGWYRIPQHATIVFLAALGGELLWRAAPQLHVHGRKALVSMTVLGLLVATSVSALRAPLGRFYFAPLSPNPTLPPSVMYERVGQWLGQNAPDATVMFGNVGHIGWHCRCTALDDVGLVSPQVLAHLELPSRNRSGMIAAFRPDYLAFERREYEEMAAAIEAAGYVEVQRFPHAPDPSQGQSPYKIFARPDHLPAP